MTDGPGGRARPWSRWRVAVGVAAIVVLVAVAPVAVACAGGDDDGGTTAADDVAALRDGLGPGIGTVVAEFLYEDDAARALYVARAEDEEPEVVDEATADGELSFDEFTAFSDVMDAIAAGREFVTTFEQADEARDGFGSADEAEDFVRAELPGHYVDLLLAEDEIRDALVERARADDPEAVAAVGDGGISRDEAASLPAVRDAVDQMTADTLDAARAAGRSAADGAGT